MHFFNSNFYYNAQIGAKYFPASDTKTNINAMASIGSAPETAVLDYALPGSFSHTNTMVGLGGQYMVSPNITIGLMALGTPIITKPIRCEGQVRPTR